MRRRVIRVTESAVAHLKGLLDKDGKPGLGIRVVAVPSGCAGMRYRIALEDYEDEEEDIVTEESGLKVIVDTSSALYLRGAAIDYVDSPAGGGFAILNPNDNRKCGCGQALECGEGTCSSKTCE
jgi:iron-sulfur cluster assembly accessory protein